MQKILFNLVGNALKYTLENENIKITGRRTGGFYNLSVKNTGTYLTEQEQQHIFTRFYQTNSQNTGTGIGLALTKELVELHKGSIVVASNPDSGTELSFKIPVAKEAFNATEILTQELHQDQAPEATHTELDAINDTIIISEDAPILLLIDDNEDIRQYVASIFETEYTIHTASNGTEGIAKAIELVPDVIISDVMMPDEDGYSLTKKLKQNQLTSHIPITLLTAKTEDQDKLQGLQAGADAYITKPFSSSFLKTTLNTLLENRRKIQERFSKELVLLPQEVDVTSADQQFLERLQKVLEKELTNSKFTISSFADSMGVSRMQLHRKLKALTGQSTSEFIRSQRLQLAANLITNEGVSSTEAGYAVGFNEPSYFAKCFKKEYGCSPTKYAKK